VAFLVDTSGSMSIGPKVDMARRAFDEHPTAVVKARSGYFGGSSRLQVFSKPRRIPWTPGETSERDDGAKRLRINLL
jgi:hypothetical protein